LTDEPPFLLRFDPALNSPMKRLAAHSSRIVRSASGGLGYSPTVRRKG